MGTPDDRQNAGVAVPTPVSHHRQNWIAIAGLAGELLEFDQSTLAQDKIVCARVRVAVDLSKPLPRSTFIGHKGVSVWQDFLFEHIPAICTSCGMVGHVKAKCKVSSSVEGKDEPPSGKADELPGNSSVPGAQEALDPTQRPLASSSEGKAKSRRWRARKRDGLQPDGRRSTRGPRSPILLFPRIALSSNSFQVLDPPAAFVGSKLATRSELGAELVPPSDRNEMEEPFLDYPDMSAIPESVTLLAGSIAATLEEMRNTVPSKPLKSIPSCWTCPP